MSFIVCSFCLLIFFYPLNGQVLPSNLKCPPFHIFIVSSFVFVFLWYSLTCFVFNSLFLSLRGVHVIDSRVLNSAGK